MSTLTDNLEGILTCEAHLNVVNARELALGLIVLHLHFTVWCDWVGGSN